MLQITIPSNNVPEREYILDVFFKEFLDIEFMIIQDHATSDYEIRLENQNRLIIQDHFFSKFPNDLEYLKAENLPEEIIWVKNDLVVENDLPVLYGNGDIIMEEHGSSSRIVYCGVDIFASSFLMLTRWEEYVMKERDHLERFSSKNSIAFKNHFLDRPVVNEYIELLWNLLRSLGFDQERKAYRFTPYITHDIDFMFKWKNLYSLLHTLSADLLKRRSFKKFSRNIINYIDNRINRKKDPYDTFEQLMSLSENNGLRSYFFFISHNGHSNHYNSYRLNEPHVKKIFREIDQRGHFIGIHPNLYTYKDKNRWKEEFGALTRHSPQPVRFGRQHYLQFEVPYTWQIYDDMGMEWDSTMTYDDFPGFRTGTCYTYTVFNFIERKKLRVKEKPLIIMDKALVLANKANNNEQIMQRAIDLIDKVKKYNGDFVLLWHNSSFYCVEWEINDIYNSILDYLK